jgi:hypothetical protein
MSRRTLALTVAGLSIALLSGCASYRVSSNVETPAPAAAPAPGQATAPAAPAQVLLAEDSLPSRKYRELGPVEVSVKKLTIFHKDPTKEQANEALIERARTMGADAVVNVTYKTGIGFTTWGYIDAKGTAVKLLP